MPLTVFESTSLHNSAAVHFILCFYLFRMSIHVIVLFEPMSSILEA